MNLKSTLLALLPLLFTACSGTPTSVSISATQARPQQVAPTPEVGGAAGSVLKFAQGQWLGSCQSDTFSSPYRYKLVFSGLILTIETSVYQNGDCSQLLSTWASTAAITTVHSFDPDDGVFGYDLTSEATSVKMTTFNGYGAIAGNLCGISSWTDGITRDVSGRDCGADRQQTVGNESSIYIQHDTGSDELIFEEEELKRL